MLRKFKPRVKARIRKNRQILKKVFVQHIKQFQEESKTATREWMSGITFDEAKNIILEEHKKLYHKKNPQKFLSEGF